MTNIFDELRSALYSIWQRRWTALGVAWGVALLGWLVLAMIPNSYESRARIYVQLDDMLAQQIGIGQGDRKQGVDRVRQTLTSAVNLEKVIRSTPIGADITTPKQMESAVLGLAKQIKVESSQENLFIITASYANGSKSDAENAKIAQLIVQKMIDIFREENLAGNRGEMSTSLNFMDQQLAQRQKELATAEQKRMQFESQNPSLAGGAGAGLQKLEAARAELRGIDADLAAAQSALAAINGQMAGTPKTIAGMAGPVGGARGALNDAQGQLNSLRARGLTENHPDVIAARNQVSALRSAAAAEGSGGAVGMPNPAYSSLESIRGERQANVQALGSRRAAAQQEISTLTAQQFANPAAAAEYQQITRDYDVLKEQYDKLLQNREQLRIRGSIETEHTAVRFQVIDPPTSPRSPISPNRPILLFGVLLMGLGAGVAGAFALGQMRSTFATTTRLEKAIGLPVLGAISQTVTDSARVLRKKRMKYFYAASSGLFGLFVILMTIEFVQRGMVA